MSGKRVRSSKRRIRWIFGIANPKAIASHHLEGVQCRDGDDEHEVVLIWSLVSGKRRLKIDDEEMHFEVRKGSTRYSHSFQLGGGAHIVEVDCVCTLWKEKFDLRLDGKSFDRFERIYELGFPDRDSAIAAIGRLNEIGVVNAKEQYGVKRKTAEIVQDCQEEKQEVRGEVAVERENTFQSSTQGCETPESRDVDLLAEIFSQPYEEDENVSVERESTFQSSTQGCETPESGEADLLNELNELFSQPCQQEDEKTYNNSNKMTFCENKSSPFYQFVGEGNKDPCLDFLSTSLTDMAEGFV